MSVCSVFKTSYPLQKLINQLAGCHRGFFERLTASRESRSQEICCYKLDGYFAWRPHSERCEIHGSTSVFSSVNLFELSNLFDAIESSYQRQCYAQRPS